MVNGVACIFGLGCRWGARESGVEEASTSAEYLIIWPFLLLKNTLLLNKY